MTELTSHFDELLKSLRAGVEVKDRKYRLKTYKECFVGTDAVDYLIESDAAKSRQDAVRLVQPLVTDYHQIEHITRDHGFLDDYKFYRFLKPTERGSFSLNEETGKSILWADFLSDGTATEVDGENGASLLPKFPVPDMNTISPKDAHVASQVWPLDEHNTKLLDHVHPPSWTDPEPTKSGDVYDLVVIGAGTGGLVTAAGSAGVGARVALIEEHLMGGDW